ncbi:MAG: membrane protein insertion efficiency factor YidD [Verrucomicrobiota bacterium]|nr:membrane protein insertion efficiency factor YidD [Verrucomicrobiota bacterium]
MTNDKTPAPAAGSGLSSGLWRPPVVRACCRTPAVLLRQILLSVIRLYRWTISPAQTLLFGAGAGCRFTPTCSQYAMEAIRRHGALAGIWLAAKRLCRCHPWNDGGQDAVPAATNTRRKTGNKVAPGSTV